MSSYNEGYNCFAIQADKLDFHWLTVVTQLD